jgi:VanZ family protein
MRILLITLIFVLSLRADPPIDDKKILYTNLIGSATILTWGVLNWDYGKRTMHASREGWFGKDTKYRGFDKLGHFYTTFALSNFFANLYQGFGYEENLAIKQGAISSFLFNTVMEVGDSFSDYGFAYEDFICNALGSYVGYYLLMHPEVNKIIDIRIEYKPSEKITSGDSYDILTDYNGMKLLTAIKFDGFRRFQDTFMKYFEFHIGYYTRRDRGIVDAYPYMAIGVNLSHLLKPVNRRVSRFFNYYQMPYSYVSYE